MPSLVEIKHIILPGFPYILEPVGADVGLRLACGSGVGNSARNLRGVDNKLTHFSSFEFGRSDMEQVGVDRIFSVATSGWVDPQEGQRADVLLANARRDLSMAVELGRRSLMCVWTAGECLEKLKVMVSGHKKGSWLLFLEVVGIPERTAQRAMALYRRFEKSVNLSDFSSVDEAMKAIKAKNGSPPAVVDGDAGPVDGGEGDGPAAARADSNNINLEGWGPEAW